MFDQCVINFDKLHSCC